jgi:glycosyltransferase involved in cell wall biosynthesis
LRVAFSVHAYSPSVGGAERYTQGLAEGLARLGHEVHVVVADVDDPEAFYELGHEAIGTAEEIIGGVTVHRVPYGNMGYRRMGRLLGAKRVIRSSTKRFLTQLGDCLAGIDPEVVVALPHLFPNVEETIRLRASAQWKLVLVPMLHEDDPYWSIQRVSNAVVRADGVVALTDHERDRLIESYEAKLDATAVVPPGVESGEGMPYADRDAVVLFVGRRTASKRLDVLYEAMRIVWKEFPDVVLQLAGSSPGVGADPAIWIAADSRVSIIDSPTETAKDQLLGNARVVVSPSLTESFGITTLEAWAQGTPVVVTDSPVNRSVVRHGVDGLVAAGESALDLAAQVVELLRDPETASVYGLAGRRRVEAEFSWATSAKILEALIRTS